MDEQTPLTEELARAQAMMLQGIDDGAYEIVKRLVEDVETYVDQNCQTTDDTQYFAFPTLFDRLAYRRVEDDPRQLIDVGEPFNELYRCLAQLCVRQDDFQGACEALKLAVRWNPMDCASRLDLAELYKYAGDMNEYLALTYSVFERASRPRDLARAYVCFAQHYIDTKEHLLARSVLKAAEPYKEDDSSLQVLYELVGETEDDPNGLSEEDARDQLEQVGLPYGANAEIALCMLMCAKDAAVHDDRIAYAQYIMSSDALIGEEATQALWELLKEIDEDEK